MIIFVQEVLLSGDQGEEILQMEMTENSYFTTVAIILEDIKTPFFIQVVSRECAILLKKQNPPWGFP